VSNGQQQGLKTRERILNAAMDVFAEEGFNGATISEIERRVGLAPGAGSLYKHFPSKDALLNAAVDWEVRRCRAAMQEAHFGIPRWGDPDEIRMRVYLQTLRDLHMFDRLFRLMLNEGDRAPELREAIWTAVRRPIPATPTDAHVTERIAEAALTGYYLLSRMQGRPADGVEEEQFLRVLVDITRSRRRKSAVGVRG
jgi:AcrR family transcriptional regulator